MSDDIYLLDMLQAAHAPQTFVNGLDEQQFIASSLHQWAVVKQLEIIGEAANRVSQETRKALPEIPWPAMIGMRNHLVHDYRRINVTTVWLTATTDLPNLIARLAPVVPPESNPPQS